MSDNKVSSDRMKQSTKAGYYFLISKVQEVLNIDEDRASSIKAEIMFNFLKRNIVDEFYIIDPTGGDSVVNILKLSYFELFASNIKKFKEDICPRTWQYYVTFFEDETIIKEPLLQNFSQLAIHAADLTRILKNNCEYKKEYEAIELFASNNLIPKRIKEEEARYGITLDAKPMQHGKELANNKIIAILGKLLFKEQVKENFSAHNIMNLISKIDLPFKGITEQTLVTHLRKPRVLLELPETASSSDKTQQKTK